MTPMGTVRVTAKADYLDRLISTPRQGLLELIWNALDADATEVHADIQDGDLGGPIAVTVSDNGRGISADRADAEFGSLGGSWKLAARSTEGGRGLHGRQGRGRFSAYGIGHEATWDSVSDSTEGRTRTVITGRRAQPDEFNIRSEKSDAESTGTTVTLSTLPTATTRYVESDRLVEQLTSALAIYLLEYKPRVFWRERELNPSSLIEATTQLSTSVEFEGETLAIPITIIEWKNTVERALYLCNDDGIALATMHPGIQAPGFKFTAYARWNGFAERAHDLLLQDSAPEPIPSIIDAVRETLRAHFKKRFDERFTRLIDEWKAEDSYPFSGNETKPADKATRDLFDIVAIAAAPAVEKIDAKSRKFSLRLLKEAIETSPETVHSLLEEVLTLTPQEAEELRELIDKTSLSSMIAASRRISDRLEFLSSLEAMVNEPDIKKVMLERSQLHRILAGETWVFREEYALVGDDVTLRTVLKTHRDLLGDVLLTDEDVEAEVAGNDGRVGVVDLMLSKVIAQPQERKEHLIIELKRPSVHVGREQLQQIEDYAFAVATDNRFAGLQDTFEFWIIGDQLNDFVALKARQDNLEPGVTLKSSNPNITVRAVTWAQVIRDAKHRLHFVQKTLGYDPDSEAGLAYLQRRHSEFLPKSVATKTDEAARVQDGATV